MIVKIGQGDNFSKGISKLKGFLDFYIYFYSQSLFLI